MDDAVPTLHDAVIALDADHRIIYFGPGAERLFGRPAPEVVGHPLRELFAPRLADELDRALVALQRGTAAAQVANGHEPLLALDAAGHEVWLEGTLLKLVDGDAGSPLLAVLRELPTPDERQARLQDAGGARAGQVAGFPCALIRMASVPIWVKDREGRYEGASQAYAALLGLPGVELAGRTDAELLPADLARANRANDLAVFRAGVPCRHEATLAVAGEPHLLETLRIPLYGANGLPMALCGVVTDRTEAQLAHLRNAQLAAIFNGSDDAMGSESLEGVVQTWNRSAERIYGYSEAELVGRSAFILVPPEDHGHFRELLARVAGGETVARQRERRRHKDGHCFAVALTLAPLRDASGRVVGISFISRDVSPLERAEELARQLEADLATAREADRAKQAFFDVISHELRSPLTAVVGWAEMLQDEVAGPLTPEQHGYVEMLLAATHAQLALLGDVLDLARAGAGTFAVRPRPGDLAAEARAAVEMMAPQAAKAGVLLMADVPEAGPLLEFDPERLGQVFRNLLANALKFTPPGGRVLLRVRPDGDAIRCEVADTGAGITPEDLAKLFNPFTQLAAGRMREGTGLGLAICKAIVQAHGGTIGVSSAPGQGSTFWFGLPLPTSRRQAGHS